MQERCSGLAVIVFLMLFALCQPPVLSHHPRDFLVNQLDAICAASDDVASAKFVPQPQLHKLILQLSGKGTGVAKGAATFRGTQFQTVSVLYKGACSENFVPASLIVRIKFIKPGTTAILDHGYNCAKNTVDVLPNGLRRILITTQSVCDCDDMIPPGSTLLAVSLDLFCNDTNDSTTYKEMIHSLDVNGRTIPFDLTAASAFCN